MAALLGFADTDAPPPILTFLFIPPRPILVAGTQLEEMDMKAPYLAEIAMPIDAAVEGHTIATAEESETSDDDPRQTAILHPGAISPFLAIGASPAPGDIDGHSRITRQAPETSDDPG